MKIISTISTLAIALILSNANAQQAYQKDKNSVIKHDSTKGYFYKTITDFIKDKPINNVRVIARSYEYTMFVGTRFELEDESGTVFKENIKNFPSDIFTYEHYGELKGLQLTRIIKKEPYIVLVLGSFTLYVKLTDHGIKRYSIGWNGEIKQYKEKVLESYLDKYNLRKEYEADRPRREFKDTVNGYFNKYMAWQLKYVRLVNEKMNAEK